MKLGRVDTRRAARRGEAVIVFTVGELTFAIAAQAVDEIRGTESLEPVTAAFLPPRIRKVKFTLERQQHRFFVVDAGLHFRLLPSHHTRLLLLRGRGVALLVDSTERLAEITRLHALPRSFSGEEREWYRGLALLNGAVVPVVNPDAFLTPSELPLLQAALRPAAPAQGAASA
jgi:hypothetical protein